MTTNTVTRHKANAANHRPILTVKVTMPRNTRLAIVFDLLCWFSPTTCTVLRCVFLLRNNDPNETAFAALNLVVFHMARLLVLNDTSKHPFEPERNMACSAVTVLGNVKHHL
jgi:hypothetical protein